MTRYPCIRIPLALAITLCVAAGAWSQSHFRPPELSASPLFTFRGESPDRRLGHSVSGVGDLDRDGHADILVGIPGTGTTTTFAGEVQLMSGRTGMVLCTLRGRQAGDQFGWSVVGVGDLNGDGYPDVAVGAPGRQGRTNSPGYVQVLSGRCARMLFMFHGGTPGDLFGWSLAGAGDVDSDGCPDIVVGALLGGANHEGNATVFSGRDGRVLHTFTGVASYDYFGWSVGLAGDVDDDGSCDILVGAREYARLYSGRTGQRLRSFSDAPGSGIGVSVCGLGDIDADGHADYAVGFAHVAQAGAGYVELVSGKLHQVVASLRAGSPSFGQCICAVDDVDGDHVCDLLCGDSTDGAGGLAAGCASLWSGKQATGLQVCRGGAVGERLGSSVAGLGDVNGDGCPDYAVGAPQTGTNHAGYVRVYSGRELALTADVNTISLGEGGCQLLQLQTGNSHAKRCYLLAGCYSDCQPGFRLGLHAIPLNPDPYFAFTVTHPNAPPLSRSLGVLDHEGKATAAVILPPRLPAAAAGTTLHHAFVVIGNGIEFVSNPVVLTLVP